MKPKDEVTVADIAASGQVTPSVLTFIESLVGTSAPDDAYTAKLLARAELQQQVRELMDERDLDALVYPTIKQPAVKVGKTQPGSNCAMSAQTGYPALSLPAGYTGTGLPVGVELLGLPFSEPELLAMGYAFEQATQHRVGAQERAAAGARLRWGELLGPSCCGGETAVGRRPQARTQ